MKRNTFSVLFFSLFAVIATFLVSCSLETDNAGDVKGMWHLTAIENIEDGSVTDMSNRRIFWSFEVKLLELDDKDHQYPSILYRFSLQNDNLSLTEPYYFDREGENGDRVLEDVKDLQPYGISELNETFRIEAISGSKMILVSNAKRLRFKHF